MSKKQKKDKAARSTRQLMGIEEIKDYCITTRMGNLVFFIIKPTNISVLPDSSISARIYALLNVVKGQAEIEMLALNSKESFERNKDFYAHTHNTVEEAFFQKCVKELNENKKLNVQQGKPIRAINVGCMMPYMGYEPRTLKEILSAHE